jgi:hypothetical protein
VIHGRGTITLRARLTEDRLLVEVMDEGSGLAPAVRERDFENPRGGGRGLTIVDAESSRWGIHEGMTHVWFELERPGPRIAGSAPSPVDEFRVARRRPCRQAQTVGSELFSTSSPSGSMSVNS